MASAPDANGNFIAIKEDGSVIQRNIDELTSKLSSLDIEEPNEEKSEHISAYKSLFDTGENSDKANKIGHLFTNFHSKNIKQGNLLEKFINEYLEKSELNLFNKPKKWFKDQTNVKDIFKEKGVYNKCFIPAKFFDECKIKCSNKTGTEIDYVIIDDDGVTLVELKKGKDFDTKKSSGEVDSLMKIKKILEDNNVKVSKLLFVSYFAKTSDEIIIKTDLRGCEKCALYNSKIFCDDTSFSNKLCEYIDAKFKEEAINNLKEFYSQIGDIIKSYI